MYHCHAIRPGPGERVIQMIEMAEVFVLLGSNRGNRQEFISRAIEMIALEAGPVLKESAMYESEPWGFDDPIPFLNKVVEIETPLEPQDLLEKLLTIETKLGRIRPFDGCGCGFTPKASGGPAANGREPQAYAGRTIDLDVLFYGERLVFTDSLMVPHPRLHERKFALIPLHEIAPDFVHPLLRKTISELLHECRDQAKVKPLSIFDF